MKMTLIFSILAIVIVAAKGQAKSTDKKPQTAEELGREVLESFRKQSVSDYSSFFPTLPELHLLMQKNADVYQVFLGIAMEDFSKTYYEEVLPQLNTSFEKVLAAGVEKGIDWSSVELLGVSEPISERKANSIHISFASAGKQHLLVLEQVIPVEGELKVTQFISLR